MATAPRSGMLQELCRSWRFNTCRVGSCWASSLTDRFSLFRSSRSQTFCSHAPSSRHFNTGLVVLIVFAIFWAFGVDFMPLDVVQASLALLAMMFLGLAWGVVNGIIAAAFPFWMMGFFLFQMILWVASGIVFVPDALPEAIRTPLSYLPTLQGVEWMRSAYYEGYGAAILDKTYLVSFAVVTLFVGLMLERLVRGKMLQ